MIDRKCTRIARYSDPCANGPTGTRYHVEASTRGHVVYAVDSENTHRFARTYDTEKRAATYATVRNDMARAHMAPAPVATGFHVCYPVAMGRIATVRSDMVRGLFFDVPAVTVVGFQTTSTMSAGGRARAVCMLLNRMGPAPTAGPPARHPTLYGTTWAPTATGRAIERAHIDGGRWSDDEKPFTVQPSWGPTGYTIRA